MGIKLLVHHPKAKVEGQGEVSFEFDQARVVIGRSPGADVRLPELTVSELHATLAYDGTVARLRDEGSTNGTRVNGVSLVPARARTLADGDEIQIGDFTLVFSSGPILGGATSPERTASLARRLLRELSEPSQGLDAPPFLRITEGPERGTLVNLEDPPSRLVIGRSEEAGLVLSDPDVSREHAEVVRDLDGALARDLASKNGLEVNGKRLRERRLKHGDALRLGSTVLVYEDPVEQALKGLEGQPDQTLTRTREQLAPAPEEAPFEPPPPAEASPAASAPDEPAASPVDLLVYGLATVVLVASVAGLVWLFR